MVIFFYTKHCAAQGNKAMFSISRKMKNLTYYVETQLNDFDTYVKSVISFGAEIWELHKGQDGRKSAYTFLKEDSDCQQKVHSTVQYIMN